MFSLEEIEKKRQLALQKKARLLQNGSPRSQQPTSTNLFGTKRKFEANSPDRGPKQFKPINTIPTKSFFAHDSKIKATCRMISETRFEVEAPYHTQLIDFMRTIPSRLYEQKTKLWNFHIDDYSKLVNGIKAQFSGHIEVVGIPQFVLQVFKNNISATPDHSSPDLSKIDEALVYKLMPFQREGICYGIKKQGRCMIADDMGLGKTIQALGIAHYYRENWPLLIVTPSSVRYQWSEAIYQFLPSVPAQHIMQYSSGKDYLGSEKITIVSYDLLARNIDAFERKSFGFVIFDESHVLKSHKTERTKAAQRITATAKHVLLLTGTPALSRPIELYSQITLINRSFAKLYDYGIRYCEAKKNHFGWDYTGSSNTTELQLLLKSSFVLRRLKTDVLKQLPDRIRQVVMLDPELIKKGTKQMDEMAANLKNKTLKGLEKHAELLKYYSESSKQRLNAVGAYVKDLIDKNQKFIIFAHHLCVLDKISEVLDKNRVKYVRIEGKTGADQRKNYVDQFQQRDDCLVAVLSITAANSGITLTAASFVVFAELYWNPAELTQAEGRAHRIGQKSCVTVQYLVAKGTVDDILWPMLQSKANFLRSAGLDQNFELSKADLVHQPPDETSSPQDEKQNTLESFGFSQDFTSSQEEKFFTPSETLEDSNAAAKGENVKQTASTSMSEDFAKLLDDDEEDFENIDLENIS